MPDHFWALRPSEPFRLDSLVPQVGWEPGGDGGEVGPSSESPARERGPAPTERPSLFLWLLESVPVFDGVHWKADSAMALHVGHLLGLHRRRSEGSDMGPRETLGGHVATTEAAAEL